LLRSGTFFVGLQKLFPQKTLNLSKTQCAPTTRKKTCENNGRPIAIGIMELHQIIWVTAEFEAIDDTL